MAACERGHIPEAEEWFWGAKEDEGGNFLNQRSSSWRISEKHAYCMVRHSTSQSDDVEGNLVFEMRHKAAGVVGIKWVC